VLADWESAPIDSRLRATLGLLRQLTNEPSNVSAEDVRAVQAVGVSDEAISDAIYVCVLFNIIVRVADALGVEPLSAEMYEHGATYIVKNGYLPAELAVDG
jgi:alkylhydroperoxidase family enzyme